MEAALRFTWDEKKNRANRKKHRIPFEVAIEVFEDPLSIVLGGESELGEERWWMLGRIGNLTLLVVVHTVQDEDGEEVVRIISARKATPPERRMYEEAVR